MPVYRLREQVLALAGTEPPSFPCTLELSVQLVPTVPFGGVSGQSRNVVGDSQARVRIDLSTARASVVHDEPLFNPLEISVDFDGGSFRIEGNVATVGAACPDQATLERLVETLVFVFPAVLGRYIPDVPHATHAWGLLNEVPFRLQYETSDVVASTTVTSKPGQEQNVIEAWEHSLTVADTPRLSMGCQYFHTACRLLEIGYNRFEFTGEAILNFAKCLQALCGDTRDEVRIAMQQLGYDSAEIEGRFVPAMLLRDQFDVAHIALTRLTRGELRVLHDYADIAESAFRDLVGRVLDEVAAGRYETPAADLGGVSPEKRRTLRRLAEGLQPFIRS